MIENIRTVQLDTNGDGTIDCVGYFLDASSGDTPDYYGLVNENGEVDSLVPSDEFLREHGEIETLIRSHDYDFEFKSLNPLRPFSSLADSKLRRTSFHPKLKRERSHSINNPMKSSSEIFDSESKLSHISTYVDSPRSWAMRSQGAVRVKKHSKPMSPMMRSERKRINSIHNVRSTFLSQ